MLNKLVLFARRDLFCLCVVTKVFVSWWFVAMVTLLHIQLSDCAPSSGQNNNTNNVDFLSFRTRRQVSGGRSCSGIHVEITISPRVNNSQHDLLVIYWEAAVVLPGDQVLLYDHDPNDYPGDPLHSELVNDHSGWVVTGVSEGRNSSFPAVFRKICLGYWVSYVRGDSGEIAASSCLSTEPRWMEEIWHAVSRLSLASMFIPGSHNSASFKESYSAEIDNIIYKYTYNQEISILNQLLWGVRALDLRIGYYPESKEIWWCNHDFVRVRPLKQVLQDVKIFLNNTLNEIVILDIHNFPVGFMANNKAEVHKKLISYLESELREYLAPSSFGWSTSLAVLKESGKTAILAYNCKDVVSNYVWLPVQQKWGNVQNLREFVKFFEKIFETQITAPWAAMAQLTPQAFDVLFNTLGGLRQMASIVNPKLTSWFNGNWGRLCHIVHCDFIRGTGIIKAAIKWNIKRAGYHNCSVDITNK